MKSTYRNFNKENKMRLLISALLVILMIFSFIPAVFAVSKDENTSRNKLNQKVTNAVANNEYQSSTGATISGSNIVSDKTNGVVNENFESLTTKGKKALLDDMMTAVDDQIAEDSENLKDGKAGSNGGGKYVTDDTKSNWLSDLQSCDGVGSQLMTTLVQVKPDYVKALVILKPFNGVLGTVLGVLAMGLVGLLGIVIILDLSYMALPLLRNLGSEGGSGGGNRPSWVSFEAYSAVQEAEREGEGGKVWKAAMFIYIKRRSIMLIVFGIALGYLVSGQIYVLVGWILDLMRGVLKF